MCNEANALPRPKVQWILVPTVDYLTIDMFLINQSSSKFTINTINTSNEVTSVLLIQDIDSDGEFRCVLSNRGGKTEKQFIIKVEPLSKGEIVSTVIAIVVILTLVIIVNRWKFVQSIHRQKVVITFVLKSFLLRMLYFLKQ